MATFVNPTKNTSTVSNPSLSGANRTWNQATETWDENTSTWDDPYQTPTGVDRHVSTITNPTKN